MLRFKSNHPIERSLGFGVGPRPSSDAGPDLPPDQKRLTSTRRDPQPSIRTAAGEGQIPKPLRRRMSANVSATGEPGESRVARRAAGPEPPVDLLAAVSDGRTAPLLAYAQLSLKPVHAHRFHVRTCP